MKDLKRTVLPALIIAAAAVSFAGGQGYGETVQQDLYLDAPAVSLVQVPRMLSASARPKALAVRGPVKTGERDLYLLAKIIECEARYEPYEGKVAVGAVVLNRVMSDRFPNTIEGVIFQPGQFQPVTDGGWNSKEPSEQSYRAAMEALGGAKPVGQNGQSVGNAQFFIYEDLAGKGAAKWFKNNLKYVTTIGNHDFYSR
ncbi:MAG TPA: cell wall hydrolase [Bacillota bacterium]|nr:cell wall hydrolase [Bacillota bacterium]